MQTPEHYRAKAAQMTVMAAQAPLPAVSGEWLTMAAQWLALAARVEAEERVMQAYALY